MDQRAAVRVALMWAVAIACLALLSPPLSAKADALDNWSQTHIATNSLGYRGDELSGVAYGNGIYVAVGYSTASDDGRLQTSRDGVNWTNRTDTGVLLLDLYDVTFANGIFVAVGYDDYNGDDIYHSTNGINWTAHTTAVANIWGVAFGAGVFVAVSDGLLVGGYPYVQTNRQIYTSPDGINWTARNSGSPANDVQTITGVAYGAGRFIAVDSANHLYRSTTGTSTWTRTTNSAAGNQVSFCNGLFIVPAGPGTNLVSTDGLNWTELTNNSARTFGRVVYGVGNFVALSGSNILTSIDGTNWIQRNVPVSSDTVLTAATFSDRNVVAVGYAGPSSPRLPIGYISDPLLRLGIGLEFPPQLKISGVLGRTYRIEYVSKLQSNNWQSVSALTLTNSPMTWIDPSATNSSRFYRAVLLPRGRGPQHFSPNRWRQRRYQSATLAALQRL